MQSLIQALAGHPGSDLIVGLPLGIILLWIVKILYAISVEVREMKVTLFGVGNQPGVLSTQNAELKLHRRRLHRQAQVVQALVAHTGINIPQSVED